jgi:hypothetical protein
MRVYLNSIVLIIFCIAISTKIAFPQTISLDRTTNTSIKAKAEPNKEFKKKKVVYIVKNDTKNLLLGNKCADDATLQMGFQYVAMPKGRPGNKNNFHRNVNNFQSKTVILFKNGPFWKPKLKKKIKRCKVLTGDYIG